MNTAFLVPRKGLTVLQPRSAKNPTPVPLPAEGATVPLTSYWRRRLAVGDVVHSPPPKAAKTTITDKTGE
ncbi:DUF2635 domain-containing protein [Stenotrophomonas maltophilia]|uniref:DUF2635 domain-containing protein n=1 Tax=Stenotrophomonas maltophilia TaxID=40324 RepID=UPI0006AC0D8E|nr:DUF2635 domain-containing protein [Stenotrophomonas maltophilia]KOQ71552.1 hypothetical protein ABW43_00060 [Stenotrophomonas maltophilia]MBN4937101.1 DUF2635 domain-containing protein [Stenotrophomonas maltophilia]